eukprot:5037550-Ditylum_brightwellii.AAC.1
MDQQRLWQVWYVKDAERLAKKCGLSAKEVKDLNTFVKGKVDETIKEHNYNMHAMSDFKNMSISSSNKSVQSILSNIADLGAAENLVGKKYIENLPKEETKKTSWLTAMLGITCFYFTTNTK